MPICLEEVKACRDRVNGRYIRVIGIAGDYSNMNGDVLARLKELDIAPSH